MNPRTKKIVIGVAGVLLAVFAMAGLRQTSGRSAPQASIDKATLSVTTSTPAKKQWPMQLAASGAIVSWQEAIIGAETGGLRITAVHVDVGSRVRRGDPLAELARDSVQAAVRRYEASLAAAKASLAQAKANADRARLVKDSGAISDQQFNDYLALEQTGQANVDLAEAQLDEQKVILSHTRITAIDDGTITSRTALLGQVVASGTELFRLQRQDRLEWQAEVDAKQLAMIKQGATAEVTLPSGKVLHGVVRLAAPTLSTSTSRANVFVTLPNESGVKSGMFASGYIEAGRQAMLAVPESALVVRDGRNYVFEIGADNKVSRRMVATGMRREGLVTIENGLNEKARIVMSGGAFLADGDLVKVVKE